VNKWELYERRKGELKKQGLTPEEYERAIKKLVKELRL